MISLKKYLQYEYRGLFGTLFLYGLAFWAIKFIGPASGLPEYHAIDYLVRILTAFLIVALSAGLVYVIVQPLIGYNAYVAREKFRVATIHCEGGLTKAINDFAKAYAVRENNDPRTLGILRAVRILLNEIEVHAHLADELPVVERMLKSAFNQYDLAQSVSLKFVIDGKTGEYVINVDGAEFSPIKK